jgi:hypothetical protein
MADDPITDPRADIYNAYSRLLAALKWTESAVLIRVAERVTRVLNDAAAEAEAARVAKPPQRRFSLLVQAATVTPRHGSGR